MNYTEKDIAQISLKGLTIEKVNAQVQLFKTGIRPINLKEAATINNGILLLNTNQKKHFIQYYNNYLNKISVVKFVPASGAASRMFKFLFQFLADYNPKKETINAYINKNNASEMSLFILGMEKLPFYSNVLQHVPENYNSLSFDEQVVCFVKTMLNENLLNYGNIPKGLLPFHNYKKEHATAFKEHLHEATLYAANKGVAKLHFTISENHTQKFQEELKAIQPVVAKKTNTRFEVDFSYQKQCTDTVATTPDNTLFRDENNQLLFRPSGHGALIENLNDIDADIIFIKNIDNVVTSKFTEEVVANKKMLAGILLELQQEVFRYQKTLAEQSLNEQQLVDIATFLHNKLNVVISSEFEKYSKKYQIEYLSEKLNRPIRVCGMVKNEGEPGGGPFWVKSENGTISLQIVESAQIDTKNSQQKNILNSATHFNPVDIVCATKNYKGNQYNLIDFVDVNTGFIASKTRQGKKLKALELPGLWNGAMANWNTIFVEVPLETFNPVKTVNDLLKPAHQL